ncbi:ANR29 protein, partial [Amia calva]|nr:ANR29 protein [Amia calva]
MVASYSGHYECVRELIMQGADINLQRETGSTPLFFAAQQGHSDIVKLLFEFGASTEFQTKDGGTALSAACQYGHSKVVETLLKYGANVHDQLHVSLTLQCSSSGATLVFQDGTAPLWMAAQMGHSEVDGSTALFKASHKGHNDVIEELLKFSPSLSLLKNGSTALHAAVLGGNVRSVVLLLGANADPTLRNTVCDFLGAVVNLQPSLDFISDPEGGLLHPDLI